MSWEEDYLMKKAKEFETRLRKVEEESGLKWNSETSSYDEPDEDVEEDLEV